MIGYNKPRKGLFLTILICIVVMILSIIASIASSIEAIIERKGNSPKWPPGF